MAVAVCDEESCCDAVPLGVVVAVELAVRNWLPVELEVDDGESVWVGDID